MKTAALALKRVCASRGNYVLSFVLDVATAAIAIGFGISRAHEPAYALLTFMAGAFIFTFIEYGMHRWLFHAPASFAAASHHAHHFSPHQPSAMPFICGPVGGALIWLATTALLGNESGVLLTAGIMSAYLYYGVLHDLQHRIRANALPAGPMPARWMKGRWRDHAIHHSRLNRNYGVTTSLWDRVFGTYSSKRSA
jgi:sterol desaturase/sphingolipid hydroxylase (fatty acid hydroxylase superfamily)